MRLFFIVLLFVLAPAAFAQTPPSTIISDSPTVTVRMDGSPEKTTWTLSPETRPDIFEAELLDGKPRKVTFASGIDSISFVVEEGKHYDFVIRFGDAQCLTRIVGTRVVPGAVFDAGWRAAHRGKTSIEVPEVYELANIAIAMTPTGLANTNLVQHDTPYYARMRTWFAPYRHHPLLAKIDAALREKPNNYVLLKMDSAYFAFDAHGKIVKSRVYDHTTFAGSRANQMEPLLADLQDFADKSGFRAFYRDNKRTYDEQIAFYRKDADIAGMQRWLDRNFSASSGYGAYRIVFSPLVARNQSTTWFESNGFRELQPHVNFPYAEDARKRFADAPRSPAAERVFRGNIVFTEINHGYVNPETDRHADRIGKATAHPGMWVEKDKPAGSYQDLAMFEEYMNWGLVSLRYVDFAPAQDQARLLADVETMMRDRRGFIQFPAFNRFLVALYRARAPGQTIADLYPQIIAWFAAHDVIAAAPAEAGSTANVGSHR